MSADQPHFLPHFIPGVARLPQFAPPAQPLFGADLFAFVIPLGAMSYPLVPLSRGRARIDEGRAPGSSGSSAADIVAGRTLEFEQSQFGPGPLEAILALGVTEKLVVDALAAQR